MGLGFRKGKVASSSVHYQKVLWSFYFHSYTEHKNFMQIFLCYSCVTNTWFVVFVLVLTLFPH